MESNSPQRLSDRFEDIERWIIPILLGLILVVGLIRITPWVKNKIFSPPPQIVTLDAASNIDPADASEVEVNLELSPIMLNEASKAGPDLRSEDLTNSLRLASETTQAELQIEAADDIIIDDSALLTQENLPADTAPAPEMPAEQIAEQAIEQTDTPEPLAQSAELIAPEPQIEMSPEQQIDALITAWATAWADQDIERYLASYSTDHKGLRHASAEKWRAFRTARLSKPVYIKIQISDQSINIDSDNPNAASARFVQDFEMPNYADQVVKKLDLVQQQGSWKITREETLATNFIKRS